MPDYTLSQTVVSTGGSGNLFATNEKPVDMWSKRMTAFPSLTPLTVVLARMNQDKARNVRVDLIEEQHIPSSVLCTAAVAAGGTSLSVNANGPTLVVGTLLFNPRTFDLASVDSTPAANTVTITRSAGGTTAAAWVAGDVLHVLPPAVPEDDDLTYRNSSVADTNVFNYVQLIKMQFSITRVANQEHTWFGGPGAKRAQLKAQKYREFRVKGEKLRYFGGRSQTGTAPATVGMQGGLVHFLRNGTLYKDFGGLFTESGYRNMLGDFKDQNPDATEVWQFAAGHVNDMISGFALHTLRTDPNWTRFGIDVQEYVSSGLKVKLVRLPLLTDPVTRGWGFLLDMERIVLKDLDPPAFFPDAKSVGESERIIDTYREATSMLVANESRHQMFVNALA